MKNFLFLLFFLLTNIGSGQNTVGGIVLDSLTREPLPFVNIAVKGSTNGTSSTLNGKFILETENLPVVLVFSYVGYSKKEVKVTANGSIKIYLQNTGIQLNEAVVSGNYDPAWELMKKVVENSPENNPETKGNYRFTSYHKMNFTIDADSLQLAQEIKQTQSEEEKKSLTTFLKHDLFLSECVSETKFLDKNNYKETILSSRVSGFETPVLSLLTTQFQSFHFYKNEIAIGDLKYAGPISYFGLNTYRYELKDTFYLGKDTVFTLSFSPKNEKYANALKGVLQIYSNKYALYNIIAEPAADSEQGFGIKISQQYKKHENGRWFPDEFTTSLLFYDIKIGKFNLTGNGYGKITEVNFNPVLTKKEFNEFETELAADHASTEIIQEKRNLPLTNKDLKTYSVLDSLGKKHQLDRKMKMMQSLVNGYVPIKFLDWDIARLLDYNEYEGVRLSMGFYTNHKISKWFSAGGYAAFGFKDRAWKYGSEIKIKTNLKNNLSFRFTVSQDVEAGSQLNSFEKDRALFAGGYSRLFINRFDSVLKYEATIQFRAFRHFKFTLFGNHQFRNAYNNYLYFVSVNENVSLLYSGFQITEAGAEIKMAIHEKFIQTPFGNISKGTNRPVMIVRVTKGFNEFLNGELNYLRFTSVINYQLNSLRAGNFYFSLKGGFVQGETPYHLLFNPAGTYHTVKNITVYSMDGFETMRTNEFLCGQYADFHFRYRLPKPIINGKKFKPTLSFVHASAIGNSINTEQHQNLSFQSLNHLYNESGIVIDNLLKSGISGIGIGYFQRWGYYQLPLQKDNFAIKISLSVSFG